MRTSVGLALGERHLTITSPSAFAGIVLAFDEISGDGAFVNCEVHAGDTLVPLPISGARMAYELVDSASGSTVASLAA